MIEAWFIRALQRSTTMTCQITTITPEPKRRAPLPSEWIAVVPTSSSSDRLRLEREVLLRLLIEREAEVHLLRGMLSEAQRAEQRRIARELHDGVAQHIAAAYLHLQALAEIYHPRSPEARASFERAIELTRRATDEVRQVIAGAMPAVLDECGLSEAIRRETVALQRDGWQVTLQMTDVGPLPKDVAWALFRVAQEALQNVRRHAGRCRVQVTLMCSEAQVRLEIIDDGCGFDPQVIPATRFGLAGMKDRVALLGGSISIQSRPGCGTTITVYVPLKWT